MLILIESFQSRPHTLVEGSIIWATEKKIEAITDNVATVINTGLNIFTLLNF